jgi:hypothetical protein
VDVEDIIKHHGIKGQRWGIRNKINQQTGRVSGDHKITADLRVRPKPTLTNKQLQTINTRLGLEQNFNRLNPSKKEIGKKKIKAVLATVGITSVASFLKSPAGKKTMEVGQSWIAAGGKTVVKAGKNQLIKRSAKFAVKQRIKNI